MPASRLEGDCGHDSLFVLVSRVRPLLNHGLGLYIDKLGDAAYLLEVVQNSRLRDDLFLVDGKAGSRVFSHPLGCLFLTGADR